jgi:hypothetical protein
VNYIEEAYKIYYTWSDNKVPELVTVCLPWQHLTKFLVWVDDIDILAFHSCVVVFLSSIYYCLRVFWYAAARISQLEFSKTFWRGKMTFWAMSTQVVNHRCTNMTLK